MFRSNRITNKRGPDEFCHFPRAFHITLRRAHCRVCVCLCVFVCTEIVLVHHCRIPTRRYYIISLAVTQTSRFSYHVFFTYYQCDSNSYCARLGVIATLNGTYCVPYLSIAIITILCGHTRSIAAVCSVTL